MNRYTCFTDFTMEMLNEGYYIIAYIDNFFFRKPGYIHNALIYGYDPDKETIYLSDHFIDGKYATINVRYNELSLAFSLVDESHDISSDKGNIYLVKARDYDYLYDVGLTQYFTKGYLHSSDCSGYTGKISPYYTINPNHVYGITIYELLQNYIANILSESLYRLVERPFCLLKDHKLIMSMRLNYLKCTGRLTVPERNEELWQRVEKNADIILILFLKYLIGNERRHIVKIPSLLTEMKQMELEALEVFMC